MMEFKISKRCLEILKQSMVNNTLNQKEVK